MSEVLTRRCALAAVYQTGRFGLTESAVGITIQRLQGLDILQVATYPDTAERVRNIIAQQCGLAPAEQPCQAVMQEATRILWNGPQRWWIVQPENPDLLPQLRNELGVDAAVTVHSHGRVVLRLQGPATRALLAKGSAVDFHPDHFPAGWCRPLALDHFDVQLHCLNDEASVDVYIARSLAVSFWEWLLDAAGEFGVEVL